MYDAQAVNIGGNACITVTMRFTGVDGETVLHGMSTEGIAQQVTCLLPCPIPANSADRNAQSVEQAVMGGSLGPYSPGLCE